MSIDPQSFSRRQCNQRRLQFSFHGALLIAVSLIAVYLVMGIEGVLLFATAMLSFLLWRNRQRGWAIGIILSFLLATFLGVGVTKFVRLDSGDQQLRCWGIPVVIRPMEEPARTALLSLHDPEVPARWEWCAQQVGSNNADSMVFKFYYEASAWVDEDQAIAKLVVRDLATYLRTTHATHGLPDCIEMFWPEVVTHEHDHPEVIGSWRSNPEVLAYLKKRQFVVDANK